MTSAFGDPYESVNIQSNGVSYSTQLTVPQNAHILTVLPV